MVSSPPIPFKPSEFGHLPEHWYAHVMHALEVVAYYHPDETVGRKAEVCYYKMVTNLHLRPESQEDMIKRFMEDRIATGNIVS